MASSLIDSLTSLIPAGSVGALASRLGESETGVRRGVQASFGSILLGLVSQARDAGFMRQIFDLITSKASDTRALDDVAGYVAAGQPPQGDAGGNLLGTVFGGRSGTVADAIARDAGVRPGSAASLLSLAAPLVIGFLGRKIREGGLDAAGFAGLLASQKDSILAAAPAGLGSLLGFADTSRVAGVAGTTGAAAGTATATGRRWLWPAVVGAAAVVALLLLFNRNRDVVEPVAVAEDTVSPTAEAAPTPEPTVGALGAPVSRRLANGTELMIPERGIESQVIGFVEDANRPVDETTWFNFDRLTFETGSATIQPQSREQLDNVAAILQAYPSVRIKIGGYTDNTGDAAANQQLSQARAEAVRDALVAQGIDASRIEAEGYGDQFPVADNATEEGRAQNRRIALRVTAK